MLKQSNEDNEKRLNSSNTNANSNSKPLKELHCPYDTCCYVIPYPHELINHLEEHIHKIENKHSIQSSGERVIQIIQINNKNEENIHPTIPINDDEIDTSLLISQPPPISSSSSPCPPSSLSECKNNENNLYECKNCGYATKRKDHLFRHSNKHISDEEKPFKCKNCQFSTTNSSYIKNHIGKHNDGNHILNCPHCDMKLTKLMELESHLNENHSIYNEYYSCLYNDIELKCNYYECEEISSSNEDYVIHLSSHFDKDEKMKCIYKECLFVTNNEEMLIKHIENDHNNEISIYCPENDCDYHTISKKLMLEHLKEFHYNMNNNNHCTVQNCDFISNNLNILAKHRLLNHMDYKIYLCKNCDYKAKNLSTLKTHLQSHNNNKSNEKKNKPKENGNNKKKSNKLFKCEIPNCIYEGTRKYNLLLHYKTHAKYLQLYEMNRIQPNSSFIPFPIPNFTPIK